MDVTKLLTALSFLSLALAAPPALRLHSNLDSNRNYNASVRPLVMWHGLGDSYGSPGMLQFMSIVEDMHPGIFVHSIYVSEDQEEDRKAGWFGNANERIELVAGQLGSIPELSGGFDAIGFSQGGQFLRAYVERYNSPPINNLITFGSQHMGVSDLPLCEPGPSYVWCLLVRRVARGGVYGAWAQENLIQAQYFRDTTRLKQYLAGNRFLADINNETPEDYYDLASFASLPESPLPPDFEPVARTRNTTYAKNLLSLNKLILVMFTEDKTVVPKESSWFGSYDIPDAALSSSFGFESQRPLGPRSADGDPEAGSKWPQWPWDDQTVVPMRLQPIYLHDTIGLKELDERGDVLLETCVGEHMQLPKACWEDLVMKFCGGEV